MEDGEVPSAISTVFPDDGSFMTAYLQKHAQRAEPSSAAHSGGRGGIPALPNPPQPPSVAGDKAEPASAEHCVKGPRVDGDPASTHAPPAASAASGCVRS